MNYFQNHGTIIKEAVNSTMASMPNADIKVNRFDLHS